MAKVEDNFDAIIHRIEGGSREAVRETAEEIGSTAQRNAPVRTGELRDSKFVEHEDNLSRVGFSAEHGIFVNFGTYKMAANPFFSAAWAFGASILKRKAKAKLAG